MAMLMSREMLSRPEGYVAVTTADEVRQSVMGSLSYLGREGAPEIFDLFASEPRSPGLKSVTGCEVVVGQWNLRVDAVDSASEAAARRVEPNYGCNGCLLGNEVPGEAITQFSRTIPPGAKLYFYRFSAIRLHLMRSFFAQFGSLKSSVIIHSFPDALSEEIDSNSIIFFWGKKRNEELIAWARSKEIEVRFVEDGFIRSLGLGSTLSRPISITVDRQGNYYDPAELSDLEIILENREFKESELRAAESLIRLIVATGVSKYNHQIDGESFAISAPIGQRVILVPGQVDDDMSLLFGAPGMNNLKLLQRVRAANPNSYIVYKPHPDVLSKNRNGQIDNSLLSKYADMIVQSVSIATVLKHVHEVHTNTSQVGFDALLRGLRVVTYGMPFYAGWGLTTDVSRCERRTRRLSLQQLVVGVLMHYPLYINPKTGKLIDVFTAVQMMAEEKAILKANFLRRLGVWAVGWILTRCRKLIFFLTGKNMMR